MVVFEIKWFFFLLENNMVINKKKKKIIVKISLNVMWSWNDFIYVIFDNSDRVFIEFNELF